jgi:hypothetical protein
MSFIVQKAFAQVTQAHFGANDKIGNIANFYNIFVFLFNLFFWLGGTMLFASVIWAIANFAKNSATPDIEAKEALIMGSKHILMAVFVSVLLMAFSIVFKFMGDSLGATIGPRLPFELNI